MVSTVRISFAMQNAGKIQIAVTRTITTDKIFPLLIIGNINFTPF
jgi:hypothetical protein